MPAVRGFLTEVEWQNVLAAIRPGSFSTKQFKESLQQVLPSKHAQIVTEYGAGGRASGSHYSANSFFSQMLRLRVDEELLDRIGYKPAPKDWGNSIIQYWSTNTSAEGGTLFPDEVIDPVHTEGAVTQVLVNVYERNREARMACLDHYGVTCQACSIDFEETYGERGAGFIHVHHLVKISEVGAEYQVDPVRDLVPVCPNCHAMIHRKSQMLTIAELRAILAGGAAN